MATRKLSSREWAYEVEKGLKKHDVVQARDRRRHYRQLRKYVSIPIVIGVAASLTFTILYGWNQFLHAFLSWVIGITLVTAIIAFVGERWEVG